MLAMLGIEESDLEANQRSHLSTMQYERLAHRLAELGDEAPLADPKVERVTGLVWVSDSQANRREDVHLLFDDMRVILWGCNASMDGLMTVFEPNRIYTAYYIAFAGQRLLLSIEEGPDWLGGMANDLDDGLCNV